MRSICILSVLCALATPVSAQCEIDQIPQPKPTGLWFGGASIALVPGRLAVVLEPKRVNLYEPKSDGWKVSAVLTLPGTPVLANPSVALSNDILAAGMPDSADMQGQVVVYRTDGTAWTLDQILQSPAPLYGATFGAAVAVDGARILVGAPGDFFGPRHGEAVLFEHDGARWQAVSTFALGIQGDDFGAAVDLCGDTLAVGCPSERSVCLFEESDAGWVLEARFQAPGTGASPYFGSCLALDGDTLVVGEILPIGVGFVQVFERSLDGWKPGPVLQPSWGSVAKGFGSSVTVSGDRILVGAAEMSYPDPRSASGTVFVYERQGKTWIETGPAWFEDVELHAKLGRESVLVGNQAVVKGGPLSEALRMVSLGIDRKANLCPASANSSGAHASLSALGCDSFLANALTLKLVDAPADEIGLFAFSQGGPQLPFGNGSLCLLTPFEHLGGGAIDSSGQLVLDIDFTQPPAMLMAFADVWRFQAIFRDTGFGAGFGTSDAIALELQP